MIAGRCEHNFIEQPITGFWQNVGNVLQRLGAIITRWSQLAEQRRQLREMDDRMLKDIGLSHADVERITRKPFWKDPLQANECVDERYPSGGRG